MDKIIFLITLFIAVCIYLYLVIPVLYNHVNCTENIMYAHTHLRAWNYHEFGAI